jgi:hypothetical protein
VRRLIAERVRVGAGGRDDESNVETLIGQPMIDTSKLAVTIWREARASNPVTTGDIELHHRV